MKKVSILFILTSIATVSITGFSTHIDLPFIPDDPQQMFPGEKGMKWYYADEEDFVRDFPYVDIYSLSPEELEDSLRAAVGYFDRMDIVRQHHFVWTYYPSGIPSGTRTRAFVNPDGSVTVFREEEHRKMRKIKTANYTYGRGEGTPMLFSLSETLSARRIDIDFRELYSKYGYLARQVISKEEYQKRYAIAVNKLLIIREDLHGNSAKYDTVRRILKDHAAYHRNVPNRDRYLCDFINEIEEMMSPGIAERLEQNYNHHETYGCNAQFIVWAYSFWERRRMEGKEEEFYELLSTIQKDFTPRQTAEPPVFLRRRN